MSRRRKRKRSQRNNEDEAPKSSGQLPALPTSESIDKELDPPASPKRTEVQLEEEFPVVTPRHTEQSPPKNLPENPLESTPVEPADTPEEPDSSLDDELEFEEEDFDLEGNLDVVPRQSALPDRKKSEPESESSSAISQVGGFPDPNEKIPLGGLFPEKPQIGRKMESPSDLGELEEFDDELSSELGAPCPPKSPSTILRTTTLSKRFPGKTTSESYKCRIPRSRKLPTK